jgi:hypothetical protein
MVLDKIRGLAINWAISFTNVAEDKANHVLIEQKFI